MQAHNMRTNSDRLVAPLIAALLAIAIMGWWLLFTASFSLHELVLGAAFTALTLLVTALAWRGMGVFFTPTLAQVACLWRIPWYVLHDSVEVTLILLKDMTGIQRAGSHFRATGFPCEEGSHDSERVVLATAGTSVTPSIIVLGIAQDRLLLHQLQRSPLPRMIRELRDLEDRQ